MDLKTSRLPNFNPTIHGNFNREAYPRYLVNVLGVPWPDGVAVVRYDTPTSAVGLAADGTEKWRKAEVVSFDLLMQAIGFSRVHVSPLYALAFCAHVNGVGAK